MPYTDLRKQDEVAVLEDTIRQRSEQQKKAGVELDATCHICLKTKFADGVGHVCNYCHIRCCARCGGKSLTRKYEGGTKKLTEFNTCQNAQPYFPQLNKNRELQAFVRGHKGHWNR
ncbi:Uncharacterized protein GBIM_06200 [Gryllus bimaculatus]|nr:Uncharacterized protein GBIM_06200 [Gryllus bimaculatus]